MRADTIKLRRLALKTEADWVLELERMGAHCPEAIAQYPRGQEMQIRCSGLSPAAVQELEGFAHASAVVCIVSDDRSEKAEVLLVGSRAGFEQIAERMKRSPGILVELSRALSSFLQPAASAPLHLDCRGHVLDLSQRTYIMGILNCTPDSFYAGSRVQAIEEAVETGVRMVEQGADLLDVGGESTRPGSEPVSVEEEIRRVLPVIEALVARVSVPISVDTYKSEVARRALQAGAHIVNDISGLRFDPAMVEVVREYEVPVVVMHIKGRPRNMQVNPEYDDLMAELCAYFEERIAFCEGNGVPRQRVVIDPGIGFGKRFEHNYEIIRRLRELADLGQALLLGPSRKSFIGAALGLPPEERLEGTAAAVAVCIQNGAHLIRVHDVAEMARVARIADLLAARSTLGDPT